MSNYNSQLQSNNTDLQAILDSINELPDVGTDLPELTNEATAADLLSGKQLIDSDGNVVTGTIPTVAQAIPSISVNSNGLITAIVAQSTGYVNAVGGKANYKQLTTQAAKTITPTKSSQTAVASGVYTTGAVTVAPIPDEYIITTDATASADEIMSGETAYVNGNKVTGTFSIDEELSTQDDLIAQIQAAVDNLPEAGASTEWIPLASLPSTYKPAPTTTYYLEVPSNIQFLLVKRSTGWAAAAYARSYDGITTMSSGLGLFTSCTIISDSGTTYIQMVIDSGADISDLFVLPITI